MSYERMLWLLHANQISREKINAQLAREEKKETARKDTPCVVTNAKP
jgi:hypothetical protein